MRLQTTPLDEAGVLFALEGELDAYTGPPLREDLGQALTEGTRWLFVDLSRVEYMDSVGLGILVGIAKRVGEVAGGLAVVAPRPNVRRVFEVSGTHELLNVVETLDEARERLHRVQPGEGGQEQ